MKSDVYERMVDIPDGWLW